MYPYLWKIGGEAGFGIMTSGLSLAKVATRSGYEVFDYNEYPSLIRGGHNTFEVAVSQEPVLASKWNIDLLICLNEETFNRHKHRLMSESIVLYDADEFTVPAEFQTVTVPFKAIKKEHNVMQMMMNTVAIGASIALMKGDLTIFKTILEEQFMRKGQEVVDYNLKFATIGYNHIVEHFPHHIKPVLTVRQQEEKIVAAGNDIFSAGAVAADCRLYAAYPMTPSSSVLSSLAAWQKETGMIVRHAEDEISVVNTVLGASHAGVRAACGTSGGGYALMTESVAYAGLAEIPLVLFVSMRPGPATGMPTWTDQGDLLFILHGGHGEFPKIVLAPGDIEEMMTMTLQAFDFADIYQLPVIVVSDKFLSESHQSFSRSRMSEIVGAYSPNRGKTQESFNGEGPYLRYAITEDGISPRLIPGSSDHFYQANSYEHVEDSHTTEESEPRIAQVNKRNKKWQTYLQSHSTAPKIYGDSQDAQICFVSWGSTKGPILEAQKLLAARNIATQFVHFTALYPMDPEAVRNAIPQNKRLVLVETNAQRQFAKHLRMETGIHIDEALLKYDGRPFYPEEIMNYIIR